MSDVSPVARRSLDAVWWLSLIGAGYAMSQSDVWQWMGVLVMVLGAPYVFWREGVRSGASVPRRAVIASFIPLLMLGGVLSGRVVDSGAPEWVGAAIFFLAFIVPMSTLAALRYDEAQKANDPV